MEYANYYSLTKVLDACAEEGRLHSIDNTSMGPNSNAYSLLSFEVGALKCYDGYEDEQYDHRFQFATPHAFGYRSRLHFVAHCEYHSCSISPHSKSFETVHLSPPKDFGHLVTAIHQRRIPSGRWSRCLHRDSAGCQVFALAA